MARKIAQFRYYGKEGKGLERNYSPNMSAEENISSKDWMEGFITGSIFEGYKPIYQLGIQSLPGIKFRINQGRHYMVMGSSGIYDLDLVNGAKIMSLCFDPDSIKRINENPTSYLLVDILYDDEKGDS